jgi:hypothetical protein
VIINNKIVANINKKKIDEDFDIFKLSKEGKQDFFKTNVLDLPTCEFKAKSVVYTWGNIWYAMFKKDTVDNEQFKKAINDESPNTKVEKINILEDNVYPNVIVQLILNMLYSKDDEIGYKNITGKLYFLSNEWLKKDKKSGEVKTFYCLQLEIRPDMHMKMSVSTFSRLCYFKDDKLKSKAKYIFDKDTKIFRKKLKSEEPSENEIYINRSLNSKYHNTVPFLSFNSIKDFRRSKVGIYDRFLSDVEDELKEYISIKNGEYENYETVRVNNKDFENKEYSKLLESKDIVIEDLVNNLESKELINRVILELENKYNVRAKIGNLDKNAFNLRIINTPEYYEENELDDPYKEIGNDIAVQHRTIESFQSFSELTSEYKIKANKKKESATLTKIIQELIIKKDILEEKLSLVNWEICNHNCTWTFVNRKKVEYEIEGKKDKKHIYAKMEILQDGTFNINIYDDSLDYSLDWEFQEIQSAFEKYKDNKTREVEGIFYKSIDNINVILRTEQFTMPDFKKLRERLEISDGNEKISVEQIINCLNDLPDDDGDITKRKEELLQELNKFSKYETRKEVNTVLEIKKKPSQFINKYIFEQLGILINPELKNKKYINDYFIPILDIKYFYNKNKLYYFVGVEAGDLQQSLHNACIIREVVAYEKIEFEEIMRLLKVEFVRNGFNTVVPFPFKYLNEALARY